MWVFSFFLFFLNANKYSLLIVFFLPFWLFTYFVDRLCSRLTKGGRVALQFMNSQMSLLQLGPRFGPTVHAPARGLPDAAVQRVPVSAPAVPGLGGAVQSRRQTLTTTFELSVSNWLVFAPQDYRNLSQLPNFSFSAALCHFCLSQQEDGDHEERNTHRHKADQLLQNTLIMFPGGPFNGVAAPTLTCSHLLLYCADRAHCTSTC